MGCGCGKKKRSRRSILNAQERVRQRKKRPLTRASRTNRKRKIKKK